MVEAVKEVCEEIEGLIQAGQARQIDSRWEDHHLLEELLKEGSKRYRPHQLKDPLSVVSLLRKRVHYLQTTATHRGTSQTEGLPA